MNARTTATMAATILLSSALASGAGAQQKTPEQIAFQAGSVKGSAAACEVDTTAYESKVKALFDLLAQNGASASKLTEIYNNAAAETEEDQMTRPTISCQDFQIAFREFLINKPNWTPSQGWRGL